MRTLHLNIRRAAAAAAAVPAMLLIAACDPTSGVQVSTGGRSFTVEPVTPSSAPRSTPPPASPPAPSPTATTPAPTQSVTATPPLPSTTPAATTPAAAITCLDGSPAPSRDTLVSLTTSSGGEDLGACLDIPPQEMDRFIDQVIKAAVQALADGDFDSPQSREAWTSRAIPPIADEYQK